MDRIPSKDEILKWISDNPTQTSKRDIAKAFGIKGAARIALKHVLRELEDAGALAKRKRSYRDSEHLPPVAVLRVQADEDGDLWGTPIDGDRGAENAPQDIKVLLLLRDGDPALGDGDRILAKISRSDPSSDTEYSGRIIRKLTSGPRKVLGLFREASEGGRIVPIDKRADAEWLVPAGATGGARDGELVEAEQAGPRNRLGLPRARIVARLGDPSGPRAVSLIAIHHHGIPDRFPPHVLEEADQSKPAGLKGREDLRHMKFVTIDPADARDHDDACFVEPHPDGGYKLWVAIADVAHYVRPGSALEREAHKRGNSSYFPDRVVPMLPDRLSGDLCSLHEDVPRAVLAVQMHIGADGHKISHKFHRAMITSIASLTYEEVQAAQDGDPNERCAAMMDDVIAPLYDCFAAMLRAREARQPLELDLPERQIVLDDQGKVTSVAFKDRIDAHRMIEEFMVAANVAAAQQLVQAKQPLLFRVHEEPSPDKLSSLREVAESSGLVLAKGQVLQTRHLNRLLEQAAGKECAELINISTLRSMTQAYYNAGNFGHFGLALKQYAHFTSPIRRYADVIVHRGLIAACGLGDDGLTMEDIEGLDETATHISSTERRSMLAERDTTDRYLAAYMAERIGDELAGRISGIARFGVFVKLDESGADVLIPMRELGNEYFHYEQETMSLMGAESGIEITLGLRAEIKLSEAAPVTGGLVGRLLTIEGKPLPRGRGRPRSGGHKKSSKSKGRASQGAKAQKAVKKSSKTSRKKSAEKPATSGRSRVRRR